VTARADFGGGPRHVFDLMREIRKQNPHVQIGVASPLDLPFGPEFKEKADFFFELPIRSISLKTLLQFLNFCRQIGFDLIHSHGRGAGFYSRPGKILGLPIVHTFHGFGLNENTIQVLKSLSDLPLRALTDAFIAVSESEKEVALQWKVAPEEKIWVIKNGIDLTPYTCEEISKPYFKEGITFGFAARFCSQKGVDLMRERMELLLDENEKVNFVIAGDGEDLEIVESWIRETPHQERIQFLGKVQEMPAFYRSIDVLVSFSRMEGLPLALLEGMASKKICLFSDIGPHREVIESKVDGFLFDLSNPGEFLKMAQEVCERKEEWSFISTRAQEKIQNEFNLELQVKKTLALYQELSETNSNVVD